MMTYTTLPKKESYGYVLFMKLRRKYIKASSFTLPSIASYIDSEIQMIIFITFYIKASHSHCLQMQGEHPISPKICLSSSRCDTVEATL